MLRINHQINIDRSMLPLPLKQGNEAVIVDNTPLHDLFIAHTIAKILLIKDDNGGVTPPYPDPLYDSIDRGLSSIAASFVDNDYDNFGGYQGIIKKAIDVINGGDKECITYYKRLYNSPASVYPFIAGYDKDNFAILHHKKNIANNLFLQVLWYLVMLPPNKKTLLEFGKHKAIYDYIGLDSNGFPASIGGTGPKVTKKDDILYCVKFYNALLLKKGIRVKYSIEYAQVPDPDNEGEYTTDYDQPIALTLNVTGKYLLPDIKINGLATERDLYLQTINNYQVFDYLNKTSTPTIFKKLSSIYPLIQELNDFNIGLWSQYSRLFDAVLMGGEVRSWHKEPSNHNTKMGLLVGDGCLVFDAKNNPFSYCHNLKSRIIEMIDKAGFVDLINKRMDKIKGEGWHMPSFNLANIDNDDNDIIAHYLENTKDDSIKYPLQFNLNHAVFDTSFIDHDIIFRNGQCLTEALYNAIAGNKITKSGIDYLIVNGYAFNANIIYEWIKAVKSPYDNQYLRISIDYIERNGGILPRLNISCNGRVTFNCKFNGIGGDLFDYSIINNQHVASSQNNPLKVKNKVVRINTPGYKIDDTFAPILDDMIHAQVRIDRCNDNGGVMIKIDDNKTYCPKTAYHGRVMSVSIKNGEVLYNVRVKGKYNGLHLNDLFSLSPKIIYPRRYIIDDNQVIDDNGKMGIVKGLEWVGDRLHYKIHWFDDSYGLVNVHNISKDNEISMIYDVKVNYPSIEFYRPYHDKLVLLSVNDHTTVIGRIIIVSADSGSEHVIITYTHKDIYKGGGVLSFTRSMP